MASKRAQRRKEALACARKSHHETKEKAEAFLRGQRRRTPLTANGLQVYPCTICGLFLIGHRSGMHTARLRERTAKGQRRV